jgi:hypothetical protein
MTDVPQKPPFGIPLIWGEKKSGKTLAALNSPWQPVHVIDSELSTYDYTMHAERLIELRVLRGKFTVANVNTLAEYLAEVSRITDPKAKVRYGTIVLDTFGQISQWVGEDSFTKMADKADKQSQIVWGKIRDRLRAQIIALRSHCDLLITTAHQREYPPLSKKYSPRCNPAVQELASLSIRLVRDANKAIPSAEMVGARLPFFPPKIADFTLEKLLGYIQKPADWNKLEEGEKLEKEPTATVPQPSYTEEAEQES